MKLLVDTYTNTGSLHHAYALVGQREIVRDALRLFLGHTLEIDMIGNPDVLEEDYETFGIDEARMAIAFQTKSAAIHSAKKIFIFATTIITHEAQNALLKIFEEPTRDSHFFLIIPDAEILLPTLRSRLIIVQHNNAGADMSFAKTFLHSDIAERFAAIKDIIENKNRLAALALLNALETLLYARASEPKQKAEYAFIFSEIANCRAYLRGRAPSLKLILEHTALIVPRMAYE